MGFCCCSPLEGEAPYWRETAAECPFDRCTSLEVDGPENCTQAFCDSNAACGCCLPDGQCFDAFDSPIPGGWTFAACRGNGGWPGCPLLCSLFDCEDFDPGDDGPSGPFRACCLPNGDCETMQLSVCSGLNGSWREGEGDCSPELCQVIDGCRDMNQPRYNPGDKYHSKKLCETAIMGFAKRAAHLPYHDSYEPAQRGFFEPITTHETRACRVTGASVDPCERQFGKLVKGLDGYVRPAIYSEPFTEVVTGQTLSRWNLGSFVKQIEEDPADRIEPGYFGAWVGVENEPWVEFMLLSTMQRCLGVN